MPTRLSVLAALLVVPAVAQPTAPAADAYARAAELFIDGERERAEAEAVEGLRAAPDDAKLQALLDLIRQEQPPQDGGGGESGEGEQNPESGGEGESDPQQGQDGPEDEGQQADQDQTRTDEPEESETESSQPSPGEGGGTPQGEAPQQGQMSAEQAARILEAVGGEERLLLRELRRTPSRIRRTDKDW